ncbi:MAG: glycosyltransferase, partial [Chitinophagaceae bacterium]
MFLLVVIASVFLLVYSILILTYATWYKAIRPFRLANDYRSENSFSIIIPARNEAKNIAKCIHSVCNNNYPSNLFEVFVVDDFSEDETAAIVAQLQQQYQNLNLIQLSKVVDKTNLNSYKKKSIEVGIANASNDFIVCTDADCIVPENWLKNFDAHLQKTRAVFVAAPVEFFKEKTLLSEFQYIDFLAMQCITAAAVSNGFQTMCNGANLVYSRNVFYRVDGFKGIDTIASGDDMLLMEKIKAKFHNQVNYLFSKDVVVKTPAAATISEFLNQRIRWASKSKNYKDVNVIMVLILVYSLNVGLFFGLLLGLFNISLLLKILCLIVVKSVVEYYFLYQSKNLFSTFSYVKFLMLQPF